VEPYPSPARRSGKHQAAVLYPLHWPLSVGRCGSHLYEQALVWSALLHIWLSASSLYVYAPLRVGWIAVSRLILGWALHWRGSRTSITMRWRALASLYDEARAKRTVFFHLHRRDSALILAGHPNDLH
jgi:hypothetical protein